MNLTLEARSIVVGSLLGDAYLTWNGSMQIEHSYGHASYVSWKYEKLKEIVGKPPRIIERFDSRTNKTYRSFRFYTKAVLKTFRTLFYSGRKKIDPQEVRGLLDPLALAVWFMDDGSRGARTPKGLVFNTSSFSMEEQLFLQDVLCEKFGVEMSVHKVGKGFQLYVRARSFSRFSELVSPHLVTCMRYKIPVDPVTTSLETSAGESSDSISESIYDGSNTSALTFDREMKV